MAEGWSQIPDLPGDEVPIVDLHRIATKRQQSPPALALWTRRSAEALFDVSRDHLLEIRGQGWLAQGCDRQGIEAQKDRLTHIYYASSTNAIDRDLVGACARSRIHVCRVSRTRRSMTLMIRILPNACRRCAFFAPIGAELRRRRYRSIVISSLFARDTQIMMLSARSCSASTRSR